MSRLPTDERGRALGVLIGGGTTNDPPGGIALAAPNRLCAAGLTAIQTWQDKLYRPSG